MFSLNENNRFVMCVSPIDMRKGVETLCGVVKQLKLNPTNGDVYVFVSSSRQLCKLLHWERGGFVIYYKKLEAGRFHPKIFKKDCIGFSSMRYDEFYLLMEGISPKVARRKRYQLPSEQKDVNMFDTEVRRG